jgi:hypothetical protein
LLNVVVDDLTQMRPQLQRNHVPPRRIWSFIYESFELDVAEQRHLNVCMHCADVFKLCVTSESFDRMIRQLPAEDEDILAA